MKKNRVGEKYTTNEGYEIEIIEYFNSLNCTIKFKNGYIVFNRKYDHIKKGSIRNIFHPSVYGIGYHGIGRHIADEKSKSTLVYRKWVGILERGYSKKYKIKNPTYKDVTVREDWHNFQNFGDWFEDNWKPEYMDSSWCLDKDILVKGNKIYSPATCCFVPSEINTLFTKNMVTKKSDKKLTDRRKRYRLRVNINKKPEIVGLFNTPEEVFEAYKITKEVYIKEVANKWRGKITEQVYWAMYSYKI